MPYADYEYYTKTYLGRLPQDDFVSLARQASAYLDMVTFGRAARSPDLIQLRDACCAVTEELHRQAQGGEVVSATNDGYTETYAASGKSPAARLYAAAALHLAMTGLMYQGVHDAVM